MEDAKTELDPCPFCGSVDIVLQGSGTAGSPDAWVECNDCQTTGPVAGSVEGCATAWNERE
jgi:Lar family restriction alleviation protein